MNLFTRLGNGWKLAVQSMKVVAAHPELLLFPLFSGISLMLVLATFAGSILAVFGFNLDGMLTQFDAMEQTETLEYLLLFAYYLINFFIIVFFNVALVHSVRAVFEGDQPNIKASLQFALSKIGTIAQWALLAATVGTLLRALQDRLGFIGQIIVGIVGVVWSIATFFVVPVLAYEEISPIQAVKRSSEIMKEKWGEAIGANFSFGIFYFLGIIAIGITVGILLSLEFWIMAILSGLAMFVLLYLFTSTAQTIFLAAAYRRTQQQPIEEYIDENLLDQAFAKKK